MVTVTSAASTAPTVFPLMQCDSGAGDMVTLGCLATGFTPSTLTFKWKQNGKDLTDFIQYPSAQKNNVYAKVSQIQVRKQDWSNQPLTCIAELGTERREVIVKQQPVIYKLPTLRVLTSSSEVEDEASFFCYAKDFSPKSYKLRWLKNDKTVSKKIEEEIQETYPERKYENGTKLYSVSSFLTVKSTEWTHQDTFTCQFEAKDENGITTYENSSLIKQPVIDSEGCIVPDAEIEIIGPTMEEMFLNKKGKIVCQVKVNKPTLTRISWENEQGHEVVGTTQEPVKLPKDTYVYSVDISYDEWSQGVKRHCKVEHSLWLEPVQKTYERNNGGQIQRPSVFMLPPIEHSRNEMVTLSCYVKDFFPRDIFVSWLVDDEEADSSYKFHTTDPVKNGGSYYAYGQLSLTLEQWKKNDMVYSCAVHHESVANTTKAIIRSVGYRLFDKTNMVNLNMNVPQSSCK